MSKGKQVCWTRSPSGCCWDYFCQAPQGVQALRLADTCVAGTPGWIIQAFPQGSLPAWLLWSLFCSARRAGPSLACQAYQPDPFVGLALAPSSSIYKQEQENSPGIGDSKSPFISYNCGRILHEQTALDSVCQLTLHSCPGGTSLPSLPELCWEKVAFFSFGNEAGKVKAVPLAQAGSCACVFWGILVFLGGFAWCSLGAKRLPGTESRVLHEPLLCWGRSCIQEGIFQCRQCPCILGHREQVAACHPLCFPRL